MEYLDVIVQEWLVDWCISVSQEELDKEIPTEALEDPVPLELSAHDSDNESSTDPEYVAQRVWEKTRTKWWQEYEDGSGTKFGL